MIQLDLVVVGAGPAGLSAAIAAADLGRTVTLIDENPMGGGQIYRRMSDDAADPTGVDTNRGDLLRREVKERGIEHWKNSVCCDAGEGLRLRVLRDGSLVEVSARRIIIATGAQERAVPVPGWTTPGVMTTGAAQVFMKGSRVIPGGRFLLVGTGPLQLVVACQLLDAGAHVEALVEASSLWRDPGTLLLAPMLAFGGVQLLEGRGYLRQIHKAKIPIIVGHAIRRVEGSNCVTGAVIGPVDRNWRQRTVSRARERHFDVDTVLMGYGFVPSVNIAGLLGCQLRYRPELGGWVPARDALMNTTVSGVLVAGDGSGVAGSLVAELEGRIAGTTAARRRDRVSKIHVKRELRRERGRLLRIGLFRRAMDAVSTPRIGIADWTRGDTVVCRCEEVRAEEVNTSISRGATSLHGIKLQTRAGMGLCQGRMCEPAIGAILSARLGANCIAANHPRFQAPITPVPLKAWQRGKADNDG